MNEGVMKNTNRQRWDEKWMKGLKLIPEKLREGGIDRLFSFICVKGATQANEKIYQHKQKRNAKINVLCFTSPLLECPIEEIHKETSEVRR